MALHSYQTSYTVSLFRTERDRHAYKHTCHSTVISICLIPFPLRRETKLESGKKTLLILISKCKVKLIFLCYCVCLCVHESERSMELPQRKIQHSIPCEDTMLRVQATRAGISALLLDDTSSCSNFCSKATFSKSATVLCWNSFKCCITFHPTAITNDLSPSSIHLQNQY